MKAITPVISLIMLMLITVGIVGLAYVWFSGILTGSSEKAIMIPTGGAYCYGPQMFVTILNLGASSSIAASDITVAKVDGADVIRNMPSPIDPGASRVIINGYTCGGSCAGASHDVVVGTSTNIVQVRVVCK